MVDAALYPFEGRFREADGLRWHYLDEGPREAPAVVMVHGNPTWSFYWRRLVLALRGERRCIVPDHMGCGRSDRPGDDRYEYSLKQRVDDLDALLDHAGVSGKVTLVVHDWGGMIGLTWAARHPARVAALVILNTSGFHKPPNKSFPWQLTWCRMPGIGGLLVRGLNGFVKYAVKHCVTRRPLPPEVAAAYVEPYDSWTDRIAVHRFVQDIPLSPGDRGFEIVSATDRALATFSNTPTLLLWGLRDFVFDAEYLDGFRERMPHAEVHQFADSGHYLMEDAADDVVPLIEAFLAQNTPS